MQTYKIELTEDELIILSDWISRYNEREGEKFKDQAEQRVLWDIECILEKKNEFLLSENYDTRLQEAYRRVRDKVISNTN